MNKKNIQKCALAFIGIGVAALMLFVPHDSYAKVRRPPITVYGQASFDTQGAQRNFDFSMTQLSNQCSMKNGQVIGCNGGGILKYTDSDNNAYAVDVKYVNRQGSNVYFAGPVFSANHQDQVGNWLYGQVRDGGRNVPYRSIGQRMNGRPVDQVSGVFTNEDIARQNVAQFSPTGGPYYGVANGNVRVNNYPPQIPLGNMGW